jgi:hypothetical protein
MLIMKPLLYLILFFGYGIWGQDSVIMTDQFSDIETPLYHIAENARKLGKSKAILKFKRNSMYAKEKIVLHHLNDSLTTLIYHSYPEQHYYKNGEYRYFTDFDTTLYKTHHPKLVRDVIFKDTIYSEIKQYYIKEGDSILQYHCLAQRLESKDNRTNLSYYIKGLDTTSSKSVHYKNDTLNTSIWYELINNEWIATNKFTSCSTNSNSGFNQIKIKTYTDYKLDYHSGQLVLHNESTSTSIYHITNGIITQVYCHIVDENKVLQYEYDIKVKYRN